MSKIDTAWRLPELPGLPEIGHSRDDNNKKHSKNDTFSTIEPTFLNPMLFDTKP